MSDSLQKRIAERSYELFLARGGHHGYHLQDWLKAEQEMVGGAKKAPAGEAKPRKAGRPKKAAK